MYVTVMVFTQENIQKKKITLKGNTVSYRAVFITFNSIPILIDFLQSKIISLLTYTKTFYVTIKSFIEL